MYGEPQAKDWESWRWEREGDRKGRKRERERWYVGVKEGGQREEEGYKTVREGRETDTRVRGRAGDSRVGRRDGGKVRRKWRD